MYNTMHHMHAVQYIQCSNSTVLYTVYCVLCYIYIYMLTYTHTQCPCASWHGAMPCCINIMPCVITECGQNVQYNTVHRYDAIQLYIVIYVHAYICIYMHIYIHISVPSFCAECCSCSLIILLPCLPEETPDIIENAIDSGSSPWYDQYIRADR